MYEITGTTSTWQQATKTVCTVEKGIGEGGGGVIPPTWDVQGLPPS